MLLEDKRQYAVMVGWPRGVVAG